jgi:GlpG protein
MRLLCSFDNEREARVFSAFLTKEKVENQLEITSNTDWGSIDYGTISGRIWIIDEDKVQIAQKYHEEFLDDPNDQKFIGNILQIPSMIEPISSNSSQRLGDKDPVLEGPARLIKAKPIGFLTLYIIVACTLLFFFSALTQRPYETTPPNIPMTPLFTSPVNKALLYDYPYAYDIIDKIVNVYGFDKLQNLNELPPEATYLLQQYKATPIWTGLYDKVVTQLRTGIAPTYFNAPMFEKIKEGEIWRLFSPALLHSDILHLFFNMIWILILGKQMEEKIGIVRFGLFILLAGIFSNTCQYLMSGPYFIGISGVITAMITFIWFRQKRAIWEGYQLLPMTMGFITVFVGALVAMQALSFILEIQGASPFIPHIANTAHLSGAFIGWVFARTDWFARK